MEKKSLETLNEERKKTLMLGGMSLIAFGFLFMVGILTISDERFSGGDALAAIIISFVGIIVTLSMSLAKLSDLRDERKLLKR